MRDGECASFLQWALPQRRLRWKGYRKVRAQVCRRLRRRSAALGLPDLGAYRACLERDPTEWTEFDRCCPVTISRFYRDRAIYDFLAAAVLPALAAGAAHESRDLHALSLGCAAGEEPYSLALLWRFALADRYPETALRIVATDVLPDLLARARRACYPASSLKELPPAWRAVAFERRDRDCCLSPALIRDIVFLEQDVRTALPPGPFDLVFCRNLVFTYFDEPTQRRTLERLLERLRPDGALVIGRHETLPATAALEPWPGAPQPGIQRRR
jgi:chemotaxis protein methyltransferase CheR